MTYNPKVKDLVNLSLAKSVDVVQSFPWDCLDLFRILTTSYHTQKTQKKSEPLKHDCCFPRLSCFKLDDYTTTLKFISPWAVSW